MMEPKAERSAREPAGSLGRVVERVLRFVLDELDDLTLLFLQRTAERGLAPAPRTIAVLLSLRRAMARLPQMAGQLATSSADLAARVAVAVLRVFRRTTGA